MQQQAQNRKEKIRNKPLTPLEKLLAEKIDTEEKCRIQEKKLNDDFAYIQDNTASLILSGVSTLLFPPKNTTKSSRRQSLPAGQETSIAGQQASIDGQQSSFGIDGNAAKNSQLSVSDYLSIAKSLLPVAWEILQPIIIAWGIKKAKSTIAGLFSEKKRTTPRK